MSQTPKACEFCQYAHHTGHFRQALCKRRAPIAVHDPNRHAGVYADAFVPRWPMMGYQDWCGEFEALPPQSAEMKP